MNIVITGATGFVGRPLCRELTQAGHTLTALSRDVARAQSVLGPQIRSLAWNSSDNTESNSGAGKTPGGDRNETGPTPGGRSENSPADAGGEWKQAVQNADVVINLAGESVGGQRWTPEFKRKILDSRVLSTRAIVGAMRDGGRSGQSLVCASAVGYYGDRGEEELNEAAPPGQDFLADVCQQWETEAQQAETSGARVCRLRVGIVLGEGGALERMLRPIPGLPLNIYKLGLGGPIGSGRQWQPWIHLADVTGLFAWAATNGAVSGAVNVTAPAPARSRDLAQAIGRVYHRPAVFPVPGFALRLALGEFAGALLGGQKALPDAAERLGYPFRYADLDTALKNLL